MNPGASAPPRRVGAAGVPPRVHPTRRARLRAREWGRRYSTRPRLFPSECDFEARIASSVVRVHHLSGPGEPSLFDRCDGVPDRGRPGSTGGGQGFGGQATGGRSRAGRGGSRRDSVGWREALPVAQRQKSRFACGPETALPESGPACIEAVRRPGTPHCVRERDGPPDESARGMLVGRLVKPKLAPLVTASFPARITTRSFPRTVVLLWNWRNWGVGK